MIKSKSSVIAVSLALLLAQGAHAYIALNPVADGGIQYGINDSVNYGTANGLFIREYWKADGTGNNRQFFAYIRFDLSSVTNPIKAATLRVQQKDVTSYNNAITGSNFRLLGLNNTNGNTAQNWSETSLTANTLGAEFTRPASQLAAGESPFYTNRVTSFDGSVIGMTEDITADTSGLKIVKVGGQPLVDWLENRRTNGGLATLIVDFPATAYSSYYLHSRETTNAGAAPELQIYTNDVAGITPLKIWPLGDSITYGAGYAGGYRETLFTNLAAKGISIKLVGTTTGNATTLLSTYGQDSHDGHSGYSITNAVNIDDGAFRAGLYEGVESWHSSIATPDVILLMIGINDLNTGYQVDTAASRLDLLVTRLFGYYPNARILVASLPDAQQVNSYRHGATNNIAVAVSNYNAEMLSVVAVHKALGQKIERVDLHSKIGLSDLADGLHPNTNGYIKMGNVWADAVAEAPAVNATRIRVFLLAGQSNADGRANAAGQPNYPDVDFYYNTDHIHDVGVVEELTTLFTGASRDYALGPETSFGRRLADILGCDTNHTRLAIIKHAEGATSLYSNWKGGGDATTTGDGDQYLIFQQTVANGMAALTNKYPNAQISIEGMIWMQGETDAQNGHADGGEYYNNLTNFIADVRTTIKTNLPFIIGRLSNNQSNYLYRATGDAGVQQLGYAQAAQDAVVVGDHRVGIVNTDDLGMNPPNDDIHFNTASQVELGKRFAFETAYLLWVTSQLTPAQINAGMGGKDQDSDGDGANNLSEFIAGTDVASADSQFHVGIAPGGNGTFSLSYPSNPNRYFQVLICTNLAMNNWTNMSTAILGSNGMVTNSLTNSGSQAFYKIKPSVP